MNNSKWLMAVASLAFLLGILMVAPSVAQDAGDVADAAPALTLKDIAPKPLVAPAVAPVIPAPVVAPVAVPVAPLVAPLVAPVVAPVVVPDAGTVGVKAPVAVTTPPKTEAEVKTEAAGSEAPEDAVKNVSLLIRAAKNGQWSLFAGLLIMLLIFIANKAGLKEKVGAKALPWICVALGVLSSIGVMLAAGIQVDEAISQGIMAGLVATGGWELIFKYLFKKKPELHYPEKEETVVEEEAAKA
jgi:hypothetical protein